MRPIKLKLITDAIEHYIYAGNLYIALDNGSIVVYDLSDIFRSLQEKYSYDEEITGILNFSFRKNLYWRLYPISSFLKIKEVREGLQKAWERISTSEFELDLKNVYCKEIVKQVPSDVLCLKAYGNKLFMGCLNGLYVVDIESDYRKRSPIKKKFDSKIYNLNSGYSSVIFSLGQDGLGNFNPFIQAKILDRAVKDNISFNTEWTQGGSLLNYSDKNDFQFISNSITPNEKGMGLEGKYSIKEFAKNIKLRDEIVKKEDFDIIAESRLTFNGKEQNYLIDKSGNLWMSRLSVRKEHLTRISYEQALKSKLKKFGFPILGKEVAGYPIIEFEEQLCLFQNDDIYELEDESIVSLHTYPSSTHFKDLISVTAEESINLHSIDILSCPQEDLHPKINHRRVKSKHDNEDYVQVPILTAPNIIMDSNIDLPF